VKVRFTPSGRMQFLTAIACIQRDDPQAALKFRNRAEHVLRRLLRFPESGRLVPEFQDLPFREVVVPPYRFFYRRKGNVIWVVAACHGAQIPKAPSRKAGRLTNR
jgi:toxin ParE1/3/4